MQSSSHRHSTDLSASGLALCERLKKQKATHCELKGSARLTSIVHELSVECPWTASIRPHDMCKWLRSECNEVEEQILIQGSKKTVNGEYCQKSLRELESEVGDVLFDALMLNAVCSREYCFNMETCFDVACEKVERRTPYMSLWGNGSIAKSSREAELLWQEAKRKETPGPRREKPKPKTMNWREVTRSNADFFRGFLLGAAVAMSAVYLMGGRVKVQWSR